MGFTLPKHKSLGVCVDTGGKPLYLPFTGGDSAQWFPISKAASVFSQRKAGIWFNLNLHSEIPVTWQSTAHSMLVFTYQALVCDALNQIKPNKASEEEYQTLRRPVPILLKGRWLTDVKDTICIDLSLLGGRRQSRGAAALLCFALSLCHRGSFKRAPINASISLICPSIAMKTGCRRTERSALTVLSPCASENTTQAKHPATVHSIWCNRGCLDRMTRWFFLPRWQHLWLRIRGSGGGMAAFAVVGIS